MTAPNGDTWPPKPAPPESVYWAEAEEWLLKRAGQSVLTVLPEGTSRTILPDAAAGEQLEALGRQVRELRAEVAVLRDKCAIVDRLMGLIGPLLGREDLVTKFLGKVGL